MLALALGLVLFSTAQKVYHLTLPTDGWQPKIGTTNLTFARNVLGLPSDLRPGDELLAVDGMSVAGRDGRGWEDRGVRGELLRPATWQKGSTVRYTVRRGGQVFDIPVPIGGWTLEAIARSAAEQLPVRIAIFLLGIFVLLRRPHEIAARLLFLLGAAGLVPAISWVGSPGSLEEPFTSPILAMVAAYSAHASHALLVFPLMVALVLTFPGERAPLRRHPRPIAAVLIGVPILLVTLNILDLPAPYFVWVVACLLVQILWLAYALVATREPSPTRAQVRWLAFGFLLNAMGTVVSVLQGIAVLPAWLGWLAQLASLSGLMLPLALTIAILRHRLFDIDLILSRALVYGALTAFVVGAYVLIVAYLGSLFRREGDLWPSLAATAVVAVLFQPLRGWLQRVVNRLIYGERDSPYAALTRLGRQLEGTLAPETLLTTITATIENTLRLPSVTIALHDRARAAPTPGERAFPLSYGGETLGELRVAPRPGEAALSPADVRLLDDLARQAGVAVHAARTTAALQRAREQLVSAREEERRRLRRDLHDGLGPALASQALTIDTACLLLEREPHTAAALLGEVKAQAQAAIAEIRRVAYGLRPPALDDLGLLGALREHAGRYSESGLVVEVAAAEPLPPLPAAVEAAAYQIALEALTNVARHAQARHCAIALAVGDSLTLTICDDGLGMPPTRNAGVGLSSMHERAEELGGALEVITAVGGGTTIQARLPLG
jgi:signal transduction histidine kinase